MDGKEDFLNQKTLSYFSIDRYKFSETPMKCGFLRKKKQLTWYKIQKLYVLCTYE